MAEVSNIHAPCIISGTELHWKSEANIPQFSITNATRHTPQAIYINIRLSKNLKGVVPNKFFI